MITNIPDYASRNSVLLDLQLTIAANSIEDVAQASGAVRENCDSEMDETPDGNESDRPPLKVYLQGKKATAKIPINGNKDSFKIVSDPQATVIFSEKENSKNNSFLLESYSRNMIHGMEYIPFSLKVTDPEIFGHLLNESMTNMKDVRNIAICGISPEFMDAYYDNDTTLIEKLNDIEGIIRVDPH